jgi:hypothetical protein
MRGTDTPLVGPLGAQSFELAFHRCERIVW